MFAVPGDGVEGAAPPFIFHTNQVEANKSSDSGSKKWAKTMLIMPVNIGVIKTLLSIYEPYIGRDKNAVCYNANGHGRLLYRSW